MPRSEVSNPRTVHGHRRNSFRHPSRHHGSGLTAKLNLQRATSARHEHFPLGRSKINLDNSAIVDRMSKEWVFAAEKEAGTAFGEIALHQEGCRTASVIAHTWCEFIVLTKHDYQAPMSLHMSTRMLIHV